MNEKIACRRQRANLRLYNNACNALPIELRERLSRPSNLLGTYANLTWEFLSVPPVVMMVQMKHFFLPVWRHEYKGQLCALLHAQRSVDATRSSSLIRSFASKS